MPRTRRAAAVAAASSRKGPRDSLRITDAAATAGASDDGLLLARLEAYRRDLEVQFADRLAHLERRLQKDLNGFTTAFSLALSRLPRETRRMPFLAYLAREVGLEVRDSPAGGAEEQTPTAGGSDGGAEERAARDQSDAISERVKRSLRRRAPPSASATRTRGRPRAEASGLPSVREEENDPCERGAPASASTRQRPARLPRGLTSTPAGPAVTPLSTRNGPTPMPPPAAPASVCATGARLRATKSAKPGPGAATGGTGRRLPREGEEAFSQGGSPLINLCALGPEDIQLLKRSELTQLRRLRARLSDLLQRG